MPIKKEDIMNIFPDRKNIPQNYKISYLKQDEYLCDGELKKWDKEFQKVYSPVCINEDGKIKQEIIGEYPLLSEKEVMECVKSCNDAYNNGIGEWPTMPVQDRINCMLDFTYKMKEQKNLIVNLLMWEIGKTLSDSEKEFDRTVEYIYDTVNALKDLDRSSSRFVIEKGIIGQIRQAPLGIVLCMGPFNYPLNETFTTLIPALIMGNTVLFKPAKYGVLLLQPLLNAFKTSFPKGVVNTIYGDGKVIIGPIMASGKVNVLAFIGSSNVANIIEKQHPKLNRLKTVYGLNAKNPAIILEDADIDTAVKECVLGALSYNGQRCTALKILFVHKKIVAEFNKKFCDEVSRLNPGMPWETGVNITPLPETNKTSWLNDLVKDAQQSGAKIINENGGIINETFFYPAVVYPVNNKMKLYNEEQFGPVVPIVAFEDVEEPVDYIVNSDFGQQVSIFGSDSDKIAKMIDPLVNQVCRVNINSQCQRGPDTFPFTGKKDSAEGTLSVVDALKEFSIRTLVAAKENDINKTIITEILKDRKSKFLSTDFIF